MYITFDYRCSDCFAVDTRFVRKSEKDEQHCKECDSPLPLVRLPAGTRTTFRYADRKLKG